MMLDPIHQFKDHDEARRSGHDIVASADQAEPYVPLAATPSAMPAKIKSKWSDHVITAAGLRLQEYKPITYVVPDFIPEGLTILAGKPKVGKSWLALDIALAAAGNRFCLGDVKPLHGDVLYCALEDNDRRLQSRIRKILNAHEAQWPERLTLSTRWRRFDDGGVEDMAEWAASVQKPVLIIFDTLAGVRPDARPNETLHQSDYRALQKLHGWAGKNGVAVVVLHHQRKQEAEDPLDSVSGSTGLTGCADTTVVLAGTSQGMTFYVRGRDIEEATHAALFSKETCRWTILGDAAEVRLSDSRQKILAVLQDATDVMTVPEIASAAAIPRNNVDQLLTKMVPNGEVIRVSRGNYVSAKRQELIPHKNHKNKKGDPT